MNQDNEECYIIHHVTLTCQSLIKHIHESSTYFYNIVKTFGSYTRTLSWWHNIWSGIIMWHFFYLFHVWRVRTTSVVKIMNVIMYVKLYKAISKIFWKVFINIKMWTYNTEPIQSLIIEKLDSKHNAINFAIFQAVRYSFIHFNMYAYIFVLPCDWCLKE